MKTLITIVTLLHITLATTVSARNNTDDFYKCQNRTSGKWTFGIAPYACDGSPFGEDSYVEEHFSATVFDRSSSESPERRRYMQEMYGLLLGTGQIYLEQRNPNPSRDESKYWQKALLSVAHQESFWSHYRKNKNTNMQMMRGDQGHGHGLMQVDDRWHFLAVENGQAWHLMDNLVYALDIFYKAWQQAKTASCVNSRNWQEVVQGAYSAYNGGSSSICRFKDPNHRWHRNDRAFLEKYNAESWARYIDDPDKPPVTDYRCHLLGLPCDGSTDPAPPTPPYIARYSDGNSCAISETGPALCQNSLKNPVCLLAPANMDSLVPLRLATENSPTENFEMIESDEVCALTIGEENLVLPGEAIVIHKNINLRKTPGGERITVLRKDRVLTVLDYEIKYEFTLDLYYKVEWQGQIGYLYAGNNNTYADWVTRHTSDPVVEPSVLQLKSHIHYKKLKNCQQQNCTDSNDYVIGPRLERLCERVGCNYKTDLFEVLDLDSNHSRVRVLRTGKAGWVENGDIEGRL